MRTRVLPALAVAICLVAWPVLADDGPSCADCHDEVVAAMTHNVHMQIKSFEVHGATVGCESCHGDGTASPSSWDRLKLGATVMLGHASNLNASYNWWSGDNSDGNLTDWSRTNQNFTVMFSNTPASQWTWFAGYAWNDSSLDAPTTIPIFDG